MIEIRAEQPQYVSQVHTVNERAFDRPAICDHFAPSDLSISTALVFSGFKASDFR